MVEMTPASPIRCLKAPLPASPPFSDPKVNSLSTSDPQVTGLWYRVFHRFLVRFYFRRLSVLHRERIPDAGPVLYLGLHRNGAVDGFVYHAVLPGCVYLVSTQLLGNPLARLFFTGIPVSRSKDKVRVDTSEALLRGKDLLLAGGRLFVFPEGTSTLGPRHLPFKSGAARILADFLTSDRAISVVPLAIAYESPWTFRSNVEVVVGQAISTDLSGDQNADPVSVLRERITSSLEEIGVNVESAEYLEFARKIAYAATLGTSASYYETLKAIEDGVPERISSEWQELEAEMEKNRGQPLCHQGVPLFPVGVRVAYWLLFLVFAPFVLAAFALNLPPLLGSYWAGRKFSDDLNTITLWRLLAGAPLFTIWFAAVAAATAVGGYWLAGCCYAVISCLGLLSYYRVRKLAVAVYNSVRFPGLRKRALAAHRIVVDELSQAGGGQ